MADDSGTAVDSGSAPELEQSADASAETEVRYGFAEFTRALACYLKPYWVYLVLITLAILLQILYYLAFPFGLQLIFDRAIGKHDLHVLVLVLIGLAAGFLVSSGAGIGHDYLVARVGAGVLSSLRSRMFDHLQRQSASFFHRTAGGDLISRFTGDLSAFEAGVVRGVPRGIYYVILMVSSIALLFVIDWRLALATLVASPLALLGPNTFGSRASRLSMLKR